MFIKCLKQRYATKVIVWNRSSSTAGYSNSSTSSLNYLMQICLKSV